MDGGNVEVLLQWPLWTQLLLRRLSSYQQLLASSVGRAKGGEK